MSAPDEEYEDDFADAAPPPAAVSSSTAATQQRATTSSTSTTTHRHTTTAAAAHRSGKENMDTANLPPHPAASSHPAAHKPGAASAASSFHPAAPPHHYRVSIDIRAIVDLTSAPSTVHCRYHYPLFSATPAPHDATSQAASTAQPTASAAITTQPTAVTSPAATPLLEAFHLFEFLLAPSQLDQHFRAFPLHVALLAHPKAEEVAGAYLSLAALLSAPLHHKPDQQLVRVLDGDCALWKGLGGSKGGVVGVAAASGGGVDGVSEDWAVKHKLQRVGRLRVVMTLEDFGVVEVGSRTHIGAAAADPLPQQPQRPQTAANPAKFPLDTSAASATATEAAADRSSAEYQVAWEMELWRRNEQARLQTEWQATERKRLAILEQEYKRQSQLLHTTYTAKQSQLSALEKKLHHSLHTLQQREQQLTTRENELLGRIQSLEQAAQHERDEAALAVQRVRDQHAHTSAMGKRIVVDMQAQLDVLRGRLRDEEERARRLEEGWRKERAAVGKSSVGEVRLQVSELEMRCRGLEERLAEERREREREEERRMKAEAEVRRLRGDVEEKERQWLEEERRSVLRLKMEWAQRARVGGMKRDKEELEAIRRKLRQVQEEGTEPIGPGAATGGSGSGSERKERERKADEHDSSVNTTIKAPTLPTFYEQWEVRGVAADQAGDASMLDALHNGQAPAPATRDEKHEAEPQQDEHFHRSFPAATSGRHTRPSTPPPIQLHHLAASEHADRPFTGHLPAARSNKSTSTRWPDTQPDSSRGSKPVVLPAASQQESPVRQHRRAASRGQERAVEEQRVEEAEHAAEEQPTVIIERHANTPRTAQTSQSTQPPPSSLLSDQPRTAHMAPSQPSLPSFSSKTTSSSSSSASSVALSAAERQRAVERHKRAVVAARKLEAAKDTAEKREERETRERMERRREAWKKESSTARQKKGTAAAAPGRAADEKRDSAVRVERTARREEEREIASSSAYVDDDEMVALMNRHEQPASPSTAPAPHASPVRPGRSTAPAALSGTRGDGGFGVPDMWVRGQQLGRVRQQATSDQRT